MLPPFSRNTSAHKFHPQFFQDNFELEQNNHRTRVRNLIIHPTGDPFVQPNVIRRLIISLQEPGLISLIILAIPKAEEDDITGGDPDLLVHLSLDVAEPFGAIDRHGFAAAIAQHAQHLSVYLIVFFDDELWLLVVGLILSSLAILVSLSFCSSVS